LSSFVVIESFSDAPEPWQIGFQDSATPVAEGIQNLHHDIFFFLVFVLLFVVWMLGRTLWIFSSNENYRVPKGWNYDTNRKFNYVQNSSSVGMNHGTAIEIAWTVTPSIILMVLALPSFALLYSIDEIVDPSLTLKVIGHQWYWTYEYSDYANGDDTSFVFDSYMISEDDLEVGQLRLLEVDNRVVLPISTHIRVIISAADVLHSWAIPSLGVKCDAVPGRLNQTSIYLNREGVFFGQCSELCGANHGFMPIVVEGVKVEDYINWISTKINV